MQNVTKSFVREKDGTWLCIAPAELKLDGGRIRVAVGTRFIRGTPYMGVDVARLLDEHDQKVRPTS